jgi:hypothetical protein
MLDVHPPEHAAHTWRDFFIHIATIVIGLLIAVALEQTVEYIHRQRDRTELRESLNRESEQIAHDCERVEPAMTGESEWYTQFANILLKSSREHHPIGQVPTFPRRDFDIPSDPVYVAARASNQLDLLTQQEIQAYGELNEIIVNAHVAFQHRIETRDNVQKDLRSLPFSNPSLPADAYAAFRGPLDLQNVTLAPASLEELYKAMISAQINASAFRYWSRQVRGAAVELKKGDRDLQKIQTAERQFDKLP